MEKICASCKLELPLSSFYLRVGRSKKPPRHNSYCKKCDIAKSSLRRSRKPKIARLANPESKGAKIKQMLLAGKRYPEISKELGVAGSTIAYHVKALGISLKTDIDIDWSGVQEEYDRGSHIGEICKKFGVTRKVFKKGVVDGFIIVNPSRAQLSLTHDDVFCENSEAGRGSVRRWLRQNDLLPYQCAIARCYFHSNPPIWIDKPIVLHLDHINGTRNDNRLSNLRWLCPNCHSQTDTYCGKNKKIDSAPNSRNVIGNGGVA